MELNTTVIRAPFTEEQVRNLKAFQESNRFHPYTCGGQPTPLPPGTISHKGDDVSGQLENSRENCPNEGILIPTTEGWVCPCGQYTQDYAAAYMADGSLNP